MGQSPTEQKIMTFVEAVQELLKGAAVRRLEWPGDGTYVKIIGEVLSIYTPKDHQMHSLILRTGDMENNDWIIVNPS